MHSACWKHSFWDKMSSFHGSKCILTGTSSVGFGSAEQIPQACLKAKSPRAPERLTSVPLCTSRALSYWFMISTNKVVSDRSPAWPDTKGNMTQVIHVSRILSAVVKVSVTYLQQKPFPADQGINRFVQSSVDTLTAS